MIKTFLLTTLLVVSSAVSADTIRWYINDALFYDGTSASGYFDYNKATGGIDQFNVYTQSGYAYGGVPIEATQFTSANGAASFRVDTNQNIWQSLLNFQSSAEIGVDSSGYRTEKVSTLSIINPDNSGLEIDLTVSGLYSYQVTDGNLGYHTIIDTVIDSQGVATNTFTTRYLTSFSLSTNQVSAVPVAPAIWLFASGLLGIVGFARHKNT